MLLSMLFRLIYCCRVYAAPARRRQRRCAADARCRHAALLSHRYHIIIAPACRRQRCYAERDCRRRDAAEVINENEHNK